MGRPKIVLDYDSISKLSAMQCTQNEIASFLGVSVDTLQRDKQFAALYKKGMETGKISLRRTQFRIAEHSAAMAIFLGKQYLGQRDEVSMSPEDDAKFEAFFKGMAQHGLDS